ncbi:MAG TPA: DUF4198 domain-containing protein [Gemmatimonadaceae bacterium]|nr:DUF4198 domain-containing protein [Gemmatimonadaceae bacterium]
MKARIALLALLLTVAAAGALAAHDMFLKPDSFFLEPGDTLRVPLLNGTFTKSENFIELDRVRDLSLLDTGVVSHPAPLAWHAAGDTTVFGIPFKRAGTYVLGVATKPREITLKGADFNAYLKEEGITDILARREKLGQMSRAATERYAKNVKAVLQVGDARTPSVAVPLGFPAEIVPLDNPYVGQRSGTLRFQCLVDGKPVAGMTVLAGSQKGRETPVEHAHVTDAHGTIALPITRPGRWYVKFVRMVPVGHGGIDYESKWATLTFEVR